MSTGLYKTVHYAYPTSTMAVHFDRAKTGCWYVAMSDGIKETEPLMAFETREEAAAQAFGLPYPYDRYSMHEASAEDNSHA